VIASIGFEIVSEAEAEITCIASGGFGALAYSLYFGDGFVESNSTGIFTVDEIGSYYVRVTDEGGASGVNSDVIQVEINPYILSYTARSSSELIDESNTYPARIMPSVGYASAGYLSIQPAGINLVCDTNNSIWWRGTFANVTSATNFMMARQDSNVRRIGFISANRLHIQPNLTASIAYIDMPWWLKNNVLYDICILSKGAGVWELYVNGRFMGSATSTDSSITIYTLIKGLVGEVHFFGVYNRLVTVQEMAARNIITTDLKAGYFITGRGKYAYDISGNGLNLPWVGATNPWIYSDKANAYYMDNGWKLYQKDGEPDEIVPINASVTAIVAAGYTLTRTYTGSATNINMYPSAVRFRSVVQASDVRTPLAGVATIGTAGAGTISLLIHDRRQRIRKTGYLEYISLYYVDNTPANTDSVKLQIWRENPTNTFTKIHIYDITAFTKGQGTGTKTIVLPSLDVQEGDYLGFEIINNAANLVLRGVTDGINYYKCVAISTYTYAGATGATFAWKSLGSTLEASVIVNANMINPQLVAIGDSIVSGIGSDTYSFVDTIQSNLLNPQNCITGQLATLNANLSYQNLGVSGDEIVTINGDIQSPFRFYQQAMLSRPKIVVINGGINDIAGGQTNSVIVANALNMVDLSNDIGAFSIYLHITPWNTGTTQQMQNRDAIKVLINQGMATRQGVAIDLDTILGKFRVGGDVGNLWDYKDGLNFDAVHPNTAGYAAIAAEIYRVLGELNYNIYKENSNYKLLCRNNSTYQENDSRSGDGYSLVQPYMYTIDELVNSVLINTYLTDGYKDSIVVEKVENGGVTTAITSIKVKKFT
jgi:lysophospholipase L1-like esterase